MPRVLNADEPGQYQSPAERWWVIRQSYIWSIDKVAKRKFLTIAVLLSFAQLFLLPTVINAEPGLQERPLNSACIIPDRPPSSVVPGRGRNAWLTIYNVLYSMSFKLIIHNVGNVDSISGRCS